MIRNDPARKRSFAAPDAALEHPPPRSWTRPQKCMSAITKGGVATVGRWNGDGRKVEPTERFRAPHWRFIGYEHFRAKRLATFSLDWDRTLVPSFEGPTAHAEVASLRRPDCDRTDGEDAATTRSPSRRPSLVGVRADLQVPSQRHAGVWAREAARRGTSLGDASLSANSEGGQTSDGRRERPTNFRPLDVDCVS